MEKLIKAIKNDEMISLHKYISCIKEFATSVEAVKSGEIYFFLKLCLEKKQLDIFNKLVELGVPLDSTTEFGITTLLHHAACCHEMKPLIFMKMLIHNDIFAVNENNETPMHIAVKSENWNILDKLLDYCMENTKEHCNMVDNDGLSLLHILCMRGKLNHVKRFLEDIPSSDINDTVWLESKFYPGYSAMHFAATFYRYETLKILIKGGAYLNIKTSQGLTVLHILCKIDEDHWISAKAAKKFFSIEKVEIEDLKPEKECLNYINKIFQNREKSVKLLLENNCKVNTVDKNGNHILTYLTSNNTVKISLDYLYSRRCFNFVMRTITMTLKASQIRIANMLLENSEMTRSMDLSLLESAKTYTTLHKLAASGNDQIEILRVCLQLHPDLNAVDKYYATPLHIAAEKENLDFIRTLLQFGYQNGWDKMVNINALDNFGNTPLRSILYQVKARQFSVVGSSQVFCFKMILKYGTDIHLENENGTSIFSQANNYVMGKVPVRNDKRSSREIIPESIIRLIYENLVKLRQCGCYKTKLHDNFMNISAKFYHNAIPSRRYDERWLAFNYIEDLIDDSVQIQPRFQPRFQPVVEPPIFDFPQVDNVTEQDPNLESKCAVEVEKMKSTKINKYVTLDEILTRSMNTVVSYTRNAELKNILSNPDFHSQFPEYGFMLKARVARALAREKLLDEAKDSLQLLMQPDIPDLCLMEILNYLNENTLRDIIEVKRLCVKT